MKVAEFFAKIGFQIDDKALEEVDKKMVAARNQTLKLAAALTAAVYAMDRFAAASVRSAVALTNFNVQTGLSTDKLQKWQAAAQLENMAIDADSVANSIQALQQNLTQIRLGQGNASPFQLLGIDIQGRDAFDILEQVREKIQGLDPALAANLTGQMGIDPNMLNVLRLTRKEFDALGNSLSRSKGTTDALIRIGSQINRLKLGFGKFKDDLVAKLEPAFMAVVGVIESLGNGISRIINLFGVLFDKISNIYQIIKKSDLAMAVFAKTLLGIAIILAPITAAFVGLFLILDDLIVYFQGGNSIFGLAMEGLKNFAGELQAAFQPVTDTLQAIGDFTKKYTAPVNNFIAEQTGLDPNENFAGQGIKQIMEKTGLMDKMFPEGFRPGIIQDQIIMPNKVLPENSSNNTFNNTFNIGGDRPYFVADEIKDTLQNQLDYGVTDMNNGVEY